VAFYSDKHGIFRVNAFGRPSWYGWPAYYALC